MQTQKFLTESALNRCERRIDAAVADSVSVVVDSKLQKRRNGFMRVTEHGVLVAPLVLTPAMIPPLEPPDGVIELVSLRNIGRPAIKDSSQKATPGEFSSCAAAIVSLLRSGKIVHEVTTCGHSAGTSLALFSIFSSTINDPVTTTTRLTASHYPNVYSHSKLLTAIQLFDQMPRCLVGGWNSLNTGYTNSGPEGVAFDLYKGMPRMNMEHGNYTSTSMLSLVFLELLHSGRHVHFLEKWCLGWSPTFWIFTANGRSKLVKRRSKCGDWRNLERVYKSCI